ncbi:MAG: hypothetical protein ACI4V5_08875 [Prevotella sp.]
MKRDFDLENIGKKMPYTVPEGFFDTIEREVLAATTSEKVLSKSVSNHRFRFRTIFAAAAGLALILAFSIYNKVYDNESRQETNFTAVEQAFCNLSPTDQDYLIEAYQDDMFLQDAITEDAQ